MVGDGALLERGHRRQDVGQVLHVTDRIKPFSGPEEAGLKPGSPITRMSGVTGTGCVKMIEAVAVILGLFCAAIIIAHAVDAYLAAP